MAPDSGNATILMPPNSGSDNGGTYYGLGGILILLLGIIIGAIYWFRGEKGKGSAKGDNKKSKSNLGGKSK